MSRRRRETWCSECGLAPARRIKYAKWCSACLRKKGSPKKTCRSCGVEAFADVMNGTRCRPCVSQAAHDKRVAEVYSLTPSDYRDLLAAQGGMCFICRRKPGAKRLSVDHDHKCCPGPVSCGRCVRGLLDRACNRDILGHLRDDVEAAARVVEYLTLPPAKRLWPARNVTPMQEDE